MLPEGKVQRTFSCYEEDAKVIEVVAVQAGERRTIGRLCAFAISRCAEHLRGEPEVERVGLLRRILKGEVKL